MLKLAISGKGGSGKSTLAAGLALTRAREGHRVLAVDADPDANLAAALGIPPEARDSIEPISERKALIEERTGAKVKQYGQMFKMNPEVSDIADTCGYEHDGVSLLILGAIEAGGSGCACPESVLVRALVADLVMSRDELLVMDFEAGVEHLGRGTARGVDTMLVVVEPGRRSIDCARRVQRMSSEIGVKDIRVVANKITSPEDEAYIREALPDLPVVGTLPYSDSVRNADRLDHSVLVDADEDLQKRFKGILKTLEEDRDRG